MVLDERDRLVAEVGLDLVVTGICTGRSGSIMDPSGLDLRGALVRAKAKIPHGPSVESTVFVSICPADIVVETTPLQPFTGAVGIAIIRSALTANRSVASANKGPVAHGLRELRRLADQRGLQYRYESAVSDGLPIFSLVERTLPCVSVTAMTGLLNSTSGVILDALSQGDNLSEAIRRAEVLGILEDDPRFDLDGWDSAVKLCALSASIWDAPIAIGDVERVPITDAHETESIAARARGHRLVSMASIRRDISPNGEVRATVKIMEICPDSVFFPLVGTSLGLQFKSKLMQPVTISSFEPRLADTAYGLLADVLHIGMAGHAQ